MLMNEPDIIKDWLGFCLLDCCGDMCVDISENYLSYEPGGIGRHLTFLGAQGVLYFAMVLLLESHLLRHFCYTLHRYWSSQVIVVDADEVTDLVSEDDDVYAERRRIAETPLNDLFITDSIVIDMLSRTYHSGGGNRETVVAVDQLSFGVRCGECFGLLGINGAGKTTMFQMLTGDIFPTSGAAYINGFSIMQDIRQVVLVYVADLRRPRDGCIRWWWLSSKGRGSFGGELEVSHCNQWGCCCVVVQKCVNRSSCHLGR